MSTMDLLDPTAAKIVLAASRGDSIRRVAQKVDVAYSWAYEWVERLEAEEIIANTDTGIRVVDHDMRRQYADAMAALYRRGGVSHEDAYLVPHFAGMEFAFTELDAAYVWTHGGFQIARSHDDYPVFVEVHDRDVERWEAFFHTYGVETTVGERPDASDVDGAVHYVLIPTTDGIDAAWVDGDPVLPLDDAVELLSANRPAYEPALEIVAEEHDVDASHADARARDDSGDPQHSK